MAKSPFPGMDPYLEQVGGDVHTALITYIRDQLQGRLPPDLVGRMESRILVEDEIQGERRERRPDVHVAQSSPGGGTAVLKASSSITADRDMYLFDTQTEPETQAYIEIRDAQSGGRVITTIELISPSNKLAGVGQKLYRTKREEYLAAGVNVVEIDLTRAGDRFVLLPVLADIRPQPAYVGWVRRATQPHRIAVYLFPLDRPLKPMRIPLRPTDEDVILSLQPLIGQGYERGRYDRLDYSRPLDPPLSVTDAAVAEQFLKQAAGR